MRRSSPSLLALTVLLLTGACGEDDLFGKNDPPVADAGDDVTSTAGAEATFDGSRSRDPDGEVATYKWVFSDGGSADGKIVTHVFVNAGTFKATLTVSDVEGATHSDEALVTVEASNLPPVAIIDGPSEVVVNKDTAFDASASHDDDGAIASYLWEFSDGATGVSAAVSHRFTTLGTASVKLTVTDDRGATDVLEVTVRVKAEPVVEAPASSSWTWRSKDPNAGGTLCSFGAGPLTIAISGTSITITEQAPFSSNIYRGTYTPATRHFNTSASDGGIIDATFSADFKTFDGTYTISGLCNYTAPVTGTRR